MITMRSTALALARLGLVIAACYTSGPALAGPSRYTFTDLGTLPGYSESFPEAINQQGVVLGYSFDLEGSRASFLSDGKQMSAIPGDSSSALPTGINDAGQLAWSYSDGFGASGINQAGTVAGGEGGEAAIMAQGVVTRLGKLEPNSSSYVCWFTVNWNFRGWAQVRGRNIL